MGGFLFGPGFSCEPTLITWSPGLGPDLPFFCLLGMTFLWVGGGGRLSPSLGDEVGSSIGTISLVLIFSFRDSTCGVIHKLNEGFSASPSLTASSSLLFFPPTSPSSSHPITTYLFPPLFSPSPTSSHCFLPISYLCFIPPISFSPKLPSH